MQKKYTKNSSQSRVNKNAVNPKINTEVSYKKLNLFFFGQNTTSFSPKMPKSNTYLQPHFAQWVILHQFGSFLGQFSEAQKSEKLRKMILKVPIRTKKALHFAKKWCFLGFFGHFFISIWLFETFRVVLSIVEFSMAAKVNRCGDAFCPPTLLMCAVPISHFMLVLNSSVNIIIYCFLGEGFRYEFLPSLKSAQQKIVKWNFTIFSNLKIHW